MGFLDVTIVNIAFPDIRSSFPNSSLAGLSWVLNAYNVVFAALLVPAGRVADIVGRRRMFFIGLLTFLAASAVCGAASSVEMLVAARVVQAAGGAILVPTSLGLLLPEFPLEQRATATALWGATGAVAAATGPSLGGVLVHATDWPLPFLADALLTAPVGRRLPPPAVAFLDPHGRVRRLAEATVGGDFGGDLRPPRRPLRAAGARHSAPAPVRRRMRSVRGRTGRAGG